MQVLMQMFSAETQPESTSPQLGTDKVGQKGERHPDAVFSVELGENSDDKIADAHPVSVPVVPPQKPKLEPFVLQQDRFATASQTVVKVPGDPQGIAREQLANGSSVDHSIVVPAVTKGAVVEKSHGLLARPNLPTGATVAAPGAGLFAVNPQDKVGIAVPNSMRREELPQIPNQAVEARANARPGSVIAKTVTLPESAAARAHLATTKALLNGPQGDGSNGPAKANGVGVANGAPVSKRHSDPVNPRVLDSHTSIHSPKKAPSLDVVSPETEPTAKDLRSAVSKADNVAARFSSAEKLRDVPFVVASSMIEGTPTKAMPIKVAFRPDPTPVAMTDKTLHVSREFVPSTNIHQVVQQKPSSPSEITVLASQTPRVEPETKGWEPSGNARFETRVNNSGPDLIVKPTVAVADLPVAQAAPSQIGLLGRDVGKVQVSDGVFESESLLPGVTRDPIDGRRSEATSSKIEPLARPVIQQLTQATRSAGNGSIEVRLSPDELGRVRLSLSPGETNVTVQIFAERPETLELIRRNIEMFAATLREEGFTDLAFSFGDADSDQQRDDASERDPITFGEKRDDEGEIHSTARRANAPQSGHLDMRL